MKPPDTAADIEPGVFARALTRLGLAAEPVSDPRLMAEVLRDELRFHEAPGFAAWLGDWLRRPLPLGPLLARLDGAVERRHAPLREFLATALHEGLIPPADAAIAAIVYRAAHLLVLLDEATRAMLASDALLAELRAACLRERERLGVRQGFLTKWADLRRVSGNIFFPAKVATMDHVFLGFYARLRRAASGGGRLRGGVLVEHSLVLLLNIFEAVATDWKRGDRRNAAAGAVLLTCPIRGLRGSRDGRGVDTHLPAGWVALYTAWNFAFVLRNAPNPELILPKLLLPVLLDCEEHDYLFARGHSLWLALHLQLVARATGRARYLPGRERLAALAGIINRRHALAFASAHAGRRLCSLKEVCAHRFSR